MNPFEWKDSYSVKVGALDNQHKKLFATAEELHKAMLSGHGSDKAGEVFGRLIDYTVNHFAAEEKEVFPLAEGFPELRSLVSELKAEHEDSDKG